MTLRTRIVKLERDAPGAPDGLNALLASVASRGLRIHHRPADLVMGTPADPIELAAVLDAIQRSHSPRTLSWEARP